MLTRLRVQELPLSQPLSPEQVSRLWMWVVQVSNQHLQVQKVPREFRNLKNEDWQILMEELNLTMMEKERHSLQ